MLEWMCDIAVLEHELFTLILGARGIDLLVLQFLTINSSLFQSFGYYMSSVEPPVCLGHLLTSYPMPKRILGLAKLNGICRSNLFIVKLD